MSGAIRSALLTELAGQGKTAPTGVTVEFAVTDFRLRSGTEVFWLGVMVGSDYLAGTVTVKDGTKVLKTFEASAKSSDSAWSSMATGRVSGDSRANLFCRMIARQIA
jgi:hypothetical protein